jgi:FkbM family methyltransferase
MVSLVSEVSATQDLNSRICAAHKSNSGAQIQVIWEIGSRDGVDGVELSRTFPMASVLCFEPNPDTFQQVVDATLRAPKGSMQAFRLALCNSDEPVTFFKIDATATKTAWPDGNPGASSLYVASGDYPFEEYAQVPVLVQGRRASSLIAEGLPPPDFVWMDVQGAELEVLKGFGEYLSNVDLIHVELSLRVIYTGQALAPEVISFLANSGFRWHSVTRKGEWQFDALFLNARARRWRLSIRHYLLSLSLRTGAVFGISQSITAIPGMLWARLLRASNLS